MKRLAFLLAAAVLAGCNNDVTGLGPPSDPAKETFAASLDVDLAQMTRLPNGVYFKDIVGAPKEPTKGVQDIEHMNKSQMIEAMSQQSGGRQQARSGGSTQRASRK